MKFLEDNLGIEINLQENKIPTGQGIESFKNHEKMSRILEKETGIPWDVDHIVDIGRKYDERVIDSLKVKISTGIEHAIGYFILPAKINSIIKKLDPFKNPIFKAYFNAFYKYIEEHQNEKRYKNKATTLYKDAAIDAFNFIQLMFPEINWNETRKITKNRDFSVGGLPPDTTHKATKASNDIPDVILHPQKRRGKKENIPF